MGFPRINTTSIITSSNLGLRQLTSKSNLPKTCVANCSVDLDPQPNNTINSSASTPGLEQPNTLPSTHSPAEGNPLLDPAPTALIHSPYLSALTPPSPVRPTPVSLSPTQSSLAPLPSPAPRRSSLTFGLGISEALPYATTAQAPYPPSVAPLTYDLETTAKGTAREVLSTPSLLSLLSSKQRKTLGGLPKGVTLLSAYLLQSYVEDSIPVQTGPPWSPQALETAISKGQHASACTPGMTAFVQGKMQRMIKDGFSILLPVAYGIRLFGEKLKLSLIAAMPRAHHRPRLILNLLEQPDSDTPSVNDTTDREAAPESLKFGMASPRILQVVWEVDPIQGPVRLSKLGVTDAYHCGTVKPLQMGAFSYVIPSAPGDKVRIICIDLVLLMWWVESPKFFYVFLETLIDVANDLVETDLPVLSYGAISDIPATGPGAPHTP